MSEGRPGKTENTQSKGGRSDAEKKSDRPDWFDIQGDLDDFIFYGEDIKKCSEK